MRVSDVHPAYCSGLIKVTAGTQPVRDRLVGAQLTDARLELVERT
jgi:hypothetical protein